MSSSATSTSSQSVSCIKSGKSILNRLKPLLPSNKNGICSLSFGSGLARAVCRVYCNGRGGGEVMSSRIRRQQKQRRPLYSSIVSILPLYSYTISPLWRGHSIPVLPSISISWFNWRNSWYWQLGLLSVYSFFPFSFPCPALPSVSCSLLHPYSFLYLSILFLNCLSLACPLFLFSLLYFSFLSSLLLSFPFIFLSYLSYETFFSFFPPFFLSVFWTCFHTSVTSLSCLHVLRLLSFLCLSLFLLNCLFTSPTCPVFILSVFLSSVFFHLPSTLLTLTFLLSKLSFPLFIFSLIIIFLSVLSYIFWFCFSPYNISFTFL